MNDFVIIWKTPGGMLRKQQPAVDCDVENAAVTARQFRLDSHLPLDPGRQTGGLRQVISTAAIGNRDPHEPMLTQAPHAWSFSRISS
jgi:hypothetical protein